jgi:hypothetical protein
MRVSQMIPLRLMPGFQTQAVSRFQIPEMLFCLFAVQGNIRLLPADALCQGMYIGARYLKVG